MFLIDDKIANEDFNSLLDDGTRVELEGNTATVLSGEYEGEVFEISSEFLDTIKRCEEKELDDFIFGKSPIEGIVSIEVLDNQIYIFKKDGSIEYLPMVYWILSSRKLHPEAKRLRGYNHYNYITTFDDEDEFKQFRSKNFKKDTYTVYDNREMAMMYYGLTYFKGLRVEDVSVLSFDIEAEGLKHTKNSEVFLITNTFLKNGVETKKHFRLDHYNDSGEMITDWCNWVREINPDVITGHNIFGYDLPYLNHVAYMRGVTMYLGRDDSSIQFNERESDYRVDGNQVWKYKKCYIFGREIIDGTFTSVKYDIGRNYPSWGLKQIAEYEGFVKEDRQFYDASLIGQNWHDPVEREKIVEYGCFQPETAIITKHDGSADYIENINIKDKVISHTGEIRQVTKTYQYHYNGNIYHIISENGRSIKGVTEEHPWYVLNEETMEFEWIKTKDLKVHHKLKLNINKPIITDIVSKKYDKESLDFWWLFGIIQADGYVRIQKNNNYPVITQHKEQYHEIEKCLIRMGLNYSKIDNEKCKKKNPAKTFDFVIMDSNFGKKILDYSDGKHYAPTKKIKKDVYDYLMNNQLPAMNFVAGLFDGDGTIRETSKNGWQSMLTSTSKSLHTITDRLLNIHGINTKIEKRVRTNKRYHSIYRLYVLGIECQRLNRYFRIKHKPELEGLEYAETNNKRLFSIKKIKKEYYRGIVHNIEVDVDNSYLVNGLCSHNCDDSDDSLKIYQLQISSLFYSAQSIPRPFQEIVCSASGAWLNGIMVRGYLQNNYSIPKASEKQYVGGGMSYGVAGIYSNVSKWDAASYYPSTIMAFQMYDKIKDPKAYYLKMVTYFTHKRFDQKNKYKETGDTYWDDLQAASKVFINSAYGLMGTSGLNFNNFDIASEITRCCRKGLQKCILWATGKEYTHWWNVDETLYKKVVVSKADYDREILAKYGHQHEINEDLGDSYEVWVPRRQNKGEWKVTYKHSKTAQQDYETYKEIDAYSEWSAEEMPKHDYILTNIDTDSLSFAKADNSEWTDEEYDMLYSEINKIMYSPWEDDGQFDRFVVVKAKNYAMLENGKDKMKIKGSSFTDAKKEPALTEMLKRMLQSMIDGETNQVEIYHEYVREASNITDISRWAKKHSISEKTMEGDTTSKEKTLDALEGRSYRVGDKVYLYNAIDGMKPKMAKGKPVVLKSTGEIKMVENKVLKHVDEFDGDYDKFHYIKRVYDTVKIFETVLDMDKFICYDLKKNRELVAEL